MILPLHDIDGVLRDFSKYGIESFIKKYPKSAPFFNDYDEVDGWNLGNFVKHQKILKKLEKFLFEDPKTSYEVFLNAPPLPLVSEWSEHYDALKKMGIPVIMCTAQANTWQGKATLRWLDNNEVKYDDIVIVNDSPTKILFGDMILDDKPETIENFQSVGKIGVIFPISYNRSYIKNKLANNEELKVAHNLREYRVIIEEAQK